MFYDFPFKFFKKPPKTVSLPEVCVHVSTILTKEKYRTGKDKLTRSNRYELNVKINGSNIDSCVKVYGRKPTAEMFRRDSMAIFASIQKFSTIHMVDKDVHFHWKIHYDGE